MIVKLLVLHKGLFEALVGTMYCIVCWVCSVQCSGCSGEAQSRDPRQWRGHCLPLHQWSHGRTHLQNISYYNHYIHLLHLVHCIVHTVATH